MYVVSEFILYTCTWSQNLYYIHVRGLRICIVDIHVPGLRIHFFITRFKIEFVLMACGCMYANLVAGV